MARLLVTFAADRTRTERACGSKGAPDSEEAAACPPPARADGRGRGPRGDRRPTLPRRRSDHKALRVDARSKLAPSAAARDAWRRAGSELLRLLAVSLERCVPGRTHSPCQRYSSRSQSTGAWCGRIVAEHGDHQRLIGLGRDHRQPRLRRAVAGAAGEAFARHRVHLIDVDPGRIALKHGLERARPPRRKVDLQVEVVAAAAVAGAARASRRAGPGGSRGGCPGCGAAPRRWPRCS